MKCLGRDVYELATNPFPTLYFYLPYFACIFFPLCPIFHTMHVYNSYSAPFPIICMYTFPTLPHVSAFCHTLIKGEQKGFTTGSRILD